MLSPADYLLVLAYGLVKKSSTGDEHRFIFAALNDCFWPKAVFQHRSKTAIPNPTPTLPSPTSAAVRGAPSGVASEDAWTKLSHLLTCAHASASEMCDVRVVDPGLLGATVHCIEGANAWVDALLIRG